MKRRYHRIDGWRGYFIPATAICGASDTGTWEDSPCPTPAVLAEIRDFRRKVLRPHGIKSRTRIGQSSNVFCAKRWVCVSPKDWPRAFELANAYLDKHDKELHDLRFLHDAKGDAHAATGA